MPASSTPQVAVFYEHPDWFRPLFAELDRRGTPYARVDAGEHSFDPAEPAPPWALVFNRMSPSAWLRGRARAVAYTGWYLAHLRARGVRVVNGPDAWRTETSKAYQLTLLEALGVPYPSARVIHEPGQAPAAALGLRFPVVLKPNVGGSGAGIRRFDTPAELADAAAAGALDLGLDGTALVQEYVPARNDRIVRVEVLGGRFLYAIRVYPDGSSFNLCPADICQGVDGTSLERTACPVDAPQNGMRVEVYTPPPGIVRTVERIAAAGGIEVGGIEYMVDSRDGRTLFYDINALSNFVADGPRIVGFDPFARLADWLEAEAARAPSGAARYESHEGAPDLPEALSTPSPVEVA